MAENLVNTFVTQVIENSDYEELDRIYLTNKVFTLVGEGVADVETDSSELIDFKDQLLRQYRSLVHYQRLLHSVDQLLF